MSDSEGSDSDGSYGGRKKMRRDEAEEVAEFKIFCASFGNLTLGHLALQVLQLALDDLDHVSVGEAVGNLLLVHSGQLDIQTLWGLFEPWN